MAPTPDELAGFATPGSKGEDVSAPLIPKAFTFSIDGEPLKATEILSCERALGAIAYHSLKLVVLVLLAARSCQTRPAESETDPTDVFCPVNATSTTMTSFGLEVVS